MKPTEVFARGAWQFVPSEDDISWVERVAALDASNQPLGDYGPIVKDMLTKGVSAEAIARFAKIVGYETVFGLCYHLEDPIASYEGFPEEDEEIAWGLFQINPETDEPIEGLSCIHEVMLRMDPSGREMRPKSV
jgi:hypothetical protein